MQDRLFVDMDGTVTVFRQVDTLETLYEQGYFLNLPPQMNAVDCIKYVMEHHKEDIEVFIMSAVLTDSRYALEEKNAWIDKYLPEIDKDHRIFPPCGVDKKEYIPGGVRKTDHLMDDYTHNLTLWQPPAKGIKLMNGINDTHGTWTGNKLDYRKSGEQLAKDIVAIMQNGVVIRDIVPRKESHVENLENTKRFALLQLAQTEKGDNNRFLALEQFEPAPSGNDYDIVYFEQMESGRDVDTGKKNVELWGRFNADTLRPSNYYGTSMSVSDVVLYGDGEKVEAYFCDRMGFRKLEDTFVTEQLARRFAYGLDVKKEYDMLMQGRQDELLNILGSGYDLLARTEELKDGYRTSFELAERRRIYFERNKLDYSLILNVDLTELKIFAKHNLEVLKKGSWSSFRGSEFSDGDPVEGDVINAVHCYETFLKAVEGPSDEFEQIFEFSKDFFQWMYEKEDNLIQYADEELYRNDFFHEIIRTVAEMMEGDYSEIKKFIDDNRHIDDWLDENDCFRKDISEGLDKFEQRVNELEKSDLTQGKKCIMKKRTVLH